MKILVFVLALFPTILFPQSRKERKALEAQQKADQVVINSLKSHIQNLTNNDATHQNAEEYISTQFKTIGLKPKSTNGFIQVYSVDDGKKIAPSTYMKVNNKELEVNKDYFPLPYSLEKKVTGTPAMALRERGVPWFVDIKDLLENDSKAQKNNPEDIIKKEAVRAASKGATALLVYNSGKVADSLTFNSKDKSASTTIPVVYVTNEGYKKYFNDHSEVLNLDLNVAFKEAKINGNNVMGLMDNSAPATMVIGAHYNTPDPLNSSSSDTKSIKADLKDNKAGVALMIELAKLLATSKAKSNNYAFVAFGGPDNTSHAEHYWLDNNNLATPINYIINLDLNGYNEDKKLAVQGVNSSPVWENVFASMADKKVDINIDGGNAPSDPYTIFASQSIPQLLFTCDSSTNASAGSDKGAAITYAKELQLTKMIKQVIEAVDGKGKIAFSK